MGGVAVYGGYGVGAWERGRDGQPLGIRGGLRIGRSRSTVGADHVASRANATGSLAAASGTTSKGGSGVAESREKHVLSLSGQDDVFVCTKLFARLCPNVCT
jgi:hypothetical protein